jgi:hypothetical protein
MDAVAPLAPASLLTLWERHADDAPVHRSLALLAALDAHALTVRRRDRELVGLRGRLFGERIESCTSCPVCDEEIELSISGADLVHADAGDAGPPELLEVGRYRVRFRLPTCADLVACLELDASPEEALLSACIVESDRGGRPVSAEELPVRVRRAVADRLAVLDEDALTELGAECPACGSAFAVPFDITSHLWEELAAWADGLLDEVHTLAWAYGWSEAEILALSPGRRDRYVDRVLG